MGANGENFTGLSAKHGLKCMPDSSVSVEECLLAIKQEVGAANIKSASRMNKSIVVFLSRISLVDDLVERGLMIKDSYVSVLPLSTPSKRVVLSNVPPFITNETLERILARYGNLMSPIRLISLGCKDPDMQHVMSFRRQTFMILNSQHESLAVTIKLTVDRKDYTIYISSETMRCFSCGEHGHIRQACPKKQQTAGDSARAKPGEPVPAPSDGSSGGEIDNRPAPPSESEVPVDAADPALHGGSERPSEPTGEPAAENFVSPDPPGPLKRKASINNERRARIRSRDDQTNSQAPEPTETVALDSVEGGQPMDLTNTQTDAGDATRDDEVGLDTAETECLQDSEDEDYEADLCDDTIGGVGKRKYYTVQQLNDFLDQTKGMRNVDVASFFSDLKLFLASCSVAARKASLEELDQPKRYRLSKFKSNVRSKLNIMKKMRLRPITS